MITLAIRALLAHKLRSAVLAGGFGLGVSVIANLLGIGAVMLEQAGAPALGGGGDLVVAGSVGRVTSARFLLGSVLDRPAFADRLTVAVPNERRTLYLVRGGDAGTGGGRGGGDRDAGARDARTVPVAARGGIPSLERRLGDEETSGVAAWMDAPDDRAWTAPEPGDVLRAMDRFHPIPDVPARADSWAEWLYFNGRKGDARFYLTFLVGPEREPGRRLAGVRLQLDDGGRRSAYGETAEVDAARVLAEAPDLTIGRSRVRLDGGRYRITLDLPRMEEAPAGAPGTVPADGSAAAPAGALEAVPAYDSAAAPAGALEAVPAGGPAGAPAAAADGPGAAPAGALEAVPADAPGTVPAAGPGAAPAAAADHLAGEIVLDPDPGRSLPPFTIRGARGWTTGYVVPVMSGTLDGALDAGGRSLSLAGGTGYHDHNWGHWEGVSWQWGQVAGGGFSFVYGRVYPPADAADPERMPGFLLALGPDGPEGYATSVTIDERDAAGTDEPERITVRARSRALDLTMTLDVVDRVVSRMDRAAIGNALDFHQMRASYRVRGRVGDRHVDFTAAGAAETFRGRPMPSRPD